MQFRTVEGLTYSGNSLNKCTSDGVNSEIIPACSTVEMRSNFSIFINRTNTVDNC